MLGTAIALASERFEKKKDKGAKPDKGSFKTKFVAKPKYRGRKYRESENAFAPKNIKNWNKLK